MVTQLGAPGMGEVHYATDRLLSENTLPDDGNFKPCAVSCKKEWMS